ncbi:fungal zn binuclear cluster domain-containing protein [Stemphylium lycopersici]|uniref:Fungal zn binuclear cluster domain-containing protein n=1 Tax=Stemphylium lycopersici TaxID=183478 RepID=A0A364NFX0_STELY|nr:fungal zn binuclear cluster domain-containing protein [Stemphylium lycopersici]RAR16156.1 fungal zn binuclear cluster domain-containing protein [Stemphylium lycopersici]
MAAHKRSRTGCWTCREAGYKCDEHKPFCGRCTRLKITCKGYDIKLKWQDDAVNTPARPPRKSRKKKALDQDHFPSPGSVNSFSLTTLAISSPEHTFLSPGSPKGLPLLPLSNPDLSYGLATEERWLLNYWVDQLSNLVSVTPSVRTSTPFQRHLTAMAYESPALRSTILSMAATHLAISLDNNMLYLQGYRHQRDAIRELQQMIQDPAGMKTESALATVMMMQVSTRLFGEDDEAHVANHLTGAKAMIAHSRGENWLASSTSRFLMSLFAYHDILSSVSRGSQPLLDHQTNFTTIEGEHGLESIANVLLVVAQTSELQHAIKMRRAQSPTGPALSERENTTGRQIQQKLLAMDSAACKREDVQGSSDVRSTAEAYRHAAFIYLYRTWLDIGAPNPISVDHINQCLVHLQRVDVHSPLTTAHMWPLFTAGCEAINSNQRQSVRDRFEAMYAVKHFPSLKRVIRDVECVWMAKDMEQQMKGQDGMAKVDCIQVILKMRGREVDLA